MTRVYQTRIGREGDCLRACVASFFELPLEEVPDVGYLTQARQSGGHPPWFLDLKHWLRGRGLVPVYIPVLSGASPVPLSEAWAPPDVYVIGVLAVEGGGAHAAVCRDGRIVHDPYPFEEVRSPILGVLGWLVFCVGATGSFP